MIHLESHDREKAQKEYAGHLARCFYYRCFINGCIYHPAAFDQLLVPLQVTSYYIKRHQTFCQIIHLEALDRAVVNL